MQQGKTTNLKLELVAGFTVAALLLAACVELPERTEPAVQASQATDGTPALVPPAATSAGHGQARMSDAGEVEIADPVPPILAGTVASPAEEARQPESAPTGTLHHEPLHQPSVDLLCEQIGNKLGSVSVEDCTDQGFVFGGGFSVNQRPLVFKEQHPLQRTDDNFRVLIMGGIHGDEYSSISIIFKWMALYSPAGLEGEYHWRFAPLVNPDGLLDGDQAKRQNANGVDLNRNFPSQDWSDSAATYWQESTGSNPRRFPGRAAASEPEVQWVVSQIEEFQPDVIVSVHAPFHLLDFDGPAVAPDKIGELYLHQLGIYPGSLGNFAGLNRRIPVVTLELPSAGIMPPPEQISLMWRDLVMWLDREGRKGLGGGRQEAAMVP